VITDNSLVSDAGSILATLNPQRLGNTLIYKVLPRYYQGVATPVAMLSTTKVGQHFDFQGVAHRWLMS
jgi:hypothetical protein